MTHPVTHQTMVTGLTWVPLVTVSDLAAVVAACQSAGGGTVTTVLTLHVSSGPPAALTQESEAAAEQSGPARLATNGHPRRVPALSAGGSAAGAVSTSKLSFVDVAAPSAEQATATTAGRRGLSNLRSQVLAAGDTQRGVRGIKAITDLGCCQARASRMFTRQMR